MDNMPNIDLYSINDFETSMVKLSKCLKVLKKNALEADFSDGEIKNQYCKDVMYMKQFFERAELILRKRI